jgi:hypothetical protein
MTKDQRPIKKYPLGRLLEVSAWRSPLLANSCAPRSLLSAVGGGTRTTSDTGSRRPNAVIGSKTEETATGSTVFYPTERQYSEAFRLRLRLLQLQE